MHPTDLKDLRSVAGDIREGAFHLSKTMEVLSGLLPEPFNHQVAVAALAARELTDLATMAEGIVQ